MKSRMPRNSLSKMISLRGVAWISTAACGCSSLAAPKGGGQQSSGDGAHTPHGASQKIVRGGGQVDRQVRRILEAEFTGDQLFHRFSFVFANGAIEPLAVLGMHQ